MKIIHIICRVKMIIKSGWDICDNLTVLDQGKVLDDGTVEHIESSQRVKEVYTSRV